MKILVLVWCLQISFVSDLIFCILCFVSCVSYLTLCQILSNAQLMVNMSNVCLHVCKFS